MYSFVSLTPRIYVVTVSQKGFESVAQNNVLVTVDQVTTANIALRRNVAETVVTGTTELVDTTNSTVGQLIDSAAIDRVPLLTRNVFDLVQLSAGVTPANGAPDSSSSQAIVKASRAEHPGIDVSSYTFDGTGWDRFTICSTAALVGVAPTRHRPVSRPWRFPRMAWKSSGSKPGRLPASYQSGGAGVISLASKNPAAEEFHGDGFAVSAGCPCRQYFNKQSQLLAGMRNQTPAFHRYQEERDSNGRPIVHKKLFFFADYEYTDEELFDGSSIFTVPTTAERTGDFSNNSYTIYNPLLIPTKQQVFCRQHTYQPYNRVPALNPIAVTLYAFAPKCSVIRLLRGGYSNHLGNAPGLDPITAHHSTLAWTTTRAKSSASSPASRMPGRPWRGSTPSTTNGMDYAQNVADGREFHHWGRLHHDPTLRFFGCTLLFTRHYEAQGATLKLVPTSPSWNLTHRSLREAYKILPNVFFIDLVANHHRRHRRDRQLQHLCLCQHEATQPSRR